MSCSSVRASTCSRRSRSARTTSWLCAMMRVLTVVGLPSSATMSDSSSPAASISRNSPRTRSPARSSPMTPTREARAPSARRFASTLAAPPSRADSRRMSTTGTGASGEMRVTSPHTNSSSITSPYTTTRRSRTAATISTARSTFIGFINVSSFHPSSIFIKTPSSHARTVPRTARGRAATKLR